MIINKTMRCLHCFVVLLYDSVPVYAHSNYTDNLEEWSHWSLKNYFWIFAEPLILKLDPLFLIFVSYFTTAVTRTTETERSQLANVGRILLISAQTFFFCLDKSCTTWKKNYFKWKGSCFACKWNFKAKRSPLRRDQPSINIALPVDDLKSKIRCWIIDRANLMCMCIRKMEKIFRDA